MEHLSEGKQMSDVDVAQIVGITGASVFAAILVLVISGFFVWRRRRNAKAQLDSEESRAFDLSNDHSLPAPSASRAQSGSEDAKTSGLLDENTLQALGPQREGFGRQEGTINGTGTNDHTHGADEKDTCSVKSRHTSSTVYTTSRLLPDKTDTNAPSSIPKHTPRSMSVYTTTTQFEEDRSPVNPNFPTSVALSTRPNAFHYPRAEKPEWVRHTDTLTESPKHLSRPALSVVIPGQANKAPHRADLAANIIPLALGPATPPVQQQPGARLAADSRGGRSSYRCGSNAATEPSTQIGGAPNQDHPRMHQTAPGTADATRPTLLPQPIRTSVGSDTSFESMDPDEPTPPDEAEEKGANLTPALESPISGLRYPKVPRSSNQTVPRSPAFSNGGGRFPVHACADVMKISQESTGGASWQSGEAVQALKIPPVQYRAYRPRPQIHRKEIPKASFVRNPVTPDRRPVEGSTLSGSTLAAKRRGEMVAQDLERQLHIVGNDADFSGSAQKSSSTLPHQPVRPRDTQPSPLKDYGGVTTRQALRPAVYPHRLQRHPQEYRSNALNNQTQWRPTTASGRFEDDLYLPFGVTTPTTAEMRWE